MDAKFSDATSIVGRERTSREIRDRVSILTWRNRSAICSNGASPIVTSRRVQPSLRIRLLIKSEPLFVNE
jgi:hypothetical protein